MTLKTCTCGRANTTKTAIYKGRWDFGTRKMLMFNCPGCQSTFVVMKKEVDNGSVYTEKNEPELS